MNNPAITTTDRITAGIWGALVGDALGVPVEFLDREELRLNPVQGMRGFGTHDQPPGTWSDDGALILCTMESLLRSGFDTEDMGKRFLDWLYDGLWSAGGEMFDVGVATQDALVLITKGRRAEEAGGIDEYSNGNGSLMRMLPVVAFSGTEPMESFCRRLERASNVTHRHPRSRMACVLYGLVAKELLRGVHPAAALDFARAVFAARYRDAAEIKRFRSILESDIPSLPEEDVSSSGYVLHTLHASLWCLLTSKDYPEAVLKAVNLGADTDTTGCVTGGLAGMAFGFRSIPAQWREELPRRDDLENLIREFALHCGSGNWNPISPE